MSREAASNDRRAAEYWRSVAQADRSEARIAAANAQSLTNAARREDTPPPQSHRRAPRAQ